MESPGQERTPRTARAPKAAAAIRPAPGRRWAFALLAPLFVFGALELALRVAGSGYPTAFFFPRVTSGIATRIDNEQYTRRFFGPGLERTPWPFSVPEKKGDAYRIIVLGESAAMGDPDPSYSLARQLEVLLRARFPDRRFEVINAALIAVNSHVIRLVAREAARCQPDAFVVYAGHNEVIGPFGPGTIFQKVRPPLRFIRLSLWARALKTAQWLEGALRRVDPRSGPRVWGGMEMFLDRTFREGDPALLPVYRHFEQNLRDIIHAGRTAGADVYLCTVGVNLRTCPPFASEHTAGLTARALSEWEVHYRRGVEAELSGHFQLALEEYGQAEARDPRFADLQFRIASCHDALRRPDLAGPRFENARDEDTLRFRADSSLQSIIRRLASAGGAGVHLVDIEKQFRDAEPGGDLFADHVHMTFPGNYLIARALYEQIAPRLAPGAGPAPAPLSTGECAMWLAFTPWDQLRVQRKIFSRLIRPPFIGRIGHASSLRKLHQHIRESSSLAAADAQSLTRGMYESAIATAPADWVLHFRRGNFLLETGDTAGAREAFRETIRILPHVPQARFLQAAALAIEGRRAEALALYDGPATGTKPGTAALCLNLGLELANRGRTAAALEWFEAARKQDPGMAEAWNNLGALHAARGEYDRAMACQEKALALDARLAKAHMDLGLALLDQGQLEAAAEPLQQAALLDPNDALARYHLGVFLLTRGQAAEAQPHLARAAELRPDDPDALLYLGMAWLQLDQPQEAVAPLDQTLLYRPDSGPAHYQLATALKRLGDTPAARLHFEQAIQIQTNFVEALNDLAWLLSTRPEPRDRDPAEAIRLAETACALTRNEDPIPLDTLAVAYAAAGRFEDAVRTARQALERAEATGQQALSGEIGIRLREYEGRSRP